MFEFRACQLKKGDEFTNDDGETWQTVASTSWMDGGKTFVVQTDKGPFYLVPNSLVIVR
jgi:hypothetical protein